MYPLRSITFLAELLFAQRQHDVQVLQRVHHRAFNLDHCRYANFQVLPGGAQLSNPATGSGMVSAAWILPDRLRIQEQRTGISREDFVGRVGELAQLVLGELQVPGFVAQQFLVQSLVNPRHFENSNEFMIRSLLNLDEDDFGVFDRRPNLLGIRFSLPTSQEEPALFHMRVETYQRDPRSLFLENVGIFRTTVQTDNLQDLTTRFGQTYGCVESQLLQFISQFDGRNES